MKHMSLARFIREELGSTASDHIESIPVQMRELGQIKKLKSGKLILIRKAT